MIDQKTKASSRTKKKRLARSFPGYFGADEESVVWHGEVTAGLSQKIVLDCAVLEQDSCLKYLGYCVSFIQDSHITEKNPGVIQSGGI